MGETKILTEEMIDERLKTVRPQVLRYIDPMKMAAWKLETACEMVDNAVSEQSVLRAISSGDLEAIKTGKFITVEPAKFLVWYRRNKK